MERPRFERERRGRQRRRERCVQRGKRVRRDFRRKPSDARAAKDADKIEIQRERLSRLRGNDRTQRVEARRCDVTDERQRQVHVRRRDRATSGAFMFSKFKP